MNVGIDAFDNVYSLIESENIVVWDERTRRLLSHPDVWCSMNGGVIQINFTPGVELTQIEMVNGGCVVSWQEEDECK